MTLKDAKVLLTENDIEFELVEYKDEKEYWHHTMLYPYTKHAKPCKVIAMVRKVFGKTITNESTVRNIRLEYISVYCERTLISGNKKGI